VFTPNLIELDKKQILQHFNLKQIKFFNSNLIGQRDNKEIPLQMENNPIKQLEFKILN